MADTIVIFTDLGARIVHGDSAPYQNDPNSLINPVIPAGIPPHHWKLVDGKIGIDSDKEIERRRLALHSGETPEIKLVARSINRKELLLLLALNAAVWIATSTLLHFIFK